MLTALRHAQNYGTCAGPDALYPQICGGAAAGGGLGRWAWADISDGGSDTECTALVLALGGVARWLLGGRKAEDGLRTEDGRWGWGWEAGADRGWGAEAHSPEAPRADGRGLEFRRWFWHRVVWGVQRSMGCCSAGMMVRRCMHACTVRVGRADA